jgi:hypothetical protein
LRYAFFMQDTTQQPAVDKIRTLFTAHPQSAGEDYPTHARFAFGTGLKMIAGGLACMIHGLLPFMFERTGSTCINELSQRIANRTR